ncbi:MAG: amino acid ABC transporter substrate-binding protein [Nitrospinota bacterium]
MLAVTIFGVLLASAAWAAEPIRVGVAISATGAYSEAGTRTLQGYELWRKVINQAGGLLGRPVEFVVYDDKSDPSTGAKLYEKLITQDKVDHVLGPYSSAVTTAASTVTEKYHYPMIAGGSSSATPWSRGFKYLFQIYRPNSDANYGILGLAKERGIKTMAVIFSDDPWGVSLSGPSVFKGEELGIKAVLKQKFPKGTTDFSAFLIKAKALNPDLFLFNGHYPHGIAVLRQVKDMNLSPKMLALNFAAAFPEFAKQEKDTEGVLVYVGWEPFMNTPGNKEFVELYEKEYGNTPPLTSMWPLGG